MLGEIRDHETARISVQAALTGHLVLSTLHTNSAAASVTRLLDMGVDDFMLVSCLRGVVSQRLVRRLCEACKQPFAPSDGIASHLRSASRIDMLYRATGCDHCQHTGFRGRTVIYEILETGSAFHDAILQHAPEAELQRIARQGGMRSLVDCGVAKVTAGETTIDEVLRIASASVTS
jgi:general secretion pathway protein E